MPEGYIESPMWVGTGTRLQTRKLPADSNQEILALQDNDTKVQDRVMFIDNKDSLYINITG